MHEIKRTQRLGVEDVVGDEKRLSLLSDIEILVVDVGFMDGTLDVMQDYVDKDT